jgi:integrase
MAYLPSNENYRKEITLSECQIIEECFLLSTGSKVYEVTKRRSKGEGSIWYSKGDGRWKPQITLPNGQRRGKSARTQREVRDWLIEQRKKASDGLYIADDQIRLGDFLERYMRDVAIHRLRPRTYNRNLDLITNHISPILGNIKLSTLRPDQVQRFYAAKLDSGLSSRTVLYIHAVLHKALNQALKWGLVTQNVTDLVDRPKPGKTNFKTWSPDEIHQFLEAVLDHRWYPLYMLAIYTGLRQGELLGIHREDIDLERGVIHVRHQISAIRGQGLTITEPKTEKARRPVTIPESALEVLTQHLQIIDEGPGLIFTTSTGRPISPRNILRHFKSVIEKTGLPDIRFHDLRHTHATLLLAAGVHP